MHRWALQNSSNLLCCIAALCVLLSAGNGRAAELAGKVSLLNRKGTAPSRTARPSDVLVFYEPANPVDVEVSTQSYRLTTRQKQFHPRVLVVPEGATVEFPNLDPILHNAFSVSEPSVFDLELYGDEETPTWLFEHPGLVRVYCNVHREMFAYVWVVASPYRAMAGPDGLFRFRDLPTGLGVLTVWHERADPLRIEVDLTSGDTQLEEIALALRRPRVPLHSNKFGKPYRRRGDEY